MRRARVHRYLVSFSRWWYFFCIWQRIWTSVDRQTRILFVVGLSRWHLSFLLKPLPVTCASIIFSWVSVPFLPPLLLGILIIQFHLEIVSGIRSSWTGDGCQTCYLLSLSIWQSDSESVPRVYGVCKGLEVAVSPRSSSGLCFFLLGEYSWNVGGCRQLARVAKLSRLITRVSGSKWVLHFFLEVMYM